MGYPPVKGRLHTRYSPVRRSPSKYCYFMMPLDLHVLSLSLAFILSQDQTLHSKKTFKVVSFAQSLFRHHYWNDLQLTQKSYHQTESSVDCFRTRTCCLFQTFQYLKELFFSFKPPHRFWCESGCKDNTFFPTSPNFLRSFFWTFFIQPRLKGFMWKFRYQYVSELNRFSFHPCYRLPQIVGVSWSISLKAGAKVETFYLYTNYFDGFFQNIF